MEWIQVINCAIEYMEQHLLEDGTYKISGYKSVPAFRPGPKDMANKWITLYAYMAKEDRPWRLAHPALRRQPEISSFLKAFGKEVLRFGDGLCFRVVAAA